MTDHFSAEALLRDIAAYAESGDHRTGWPADHAASDRVARFGHAFRRVVEPLVVGTAQVARHA